MDEPLRFPSKIDWWIPVILAVATIGAPLSLYFSPRTRPLPPSTIWIVAASVTVPVLLILWLFKTTAYVISGGDLRVTGGPVNITIPVDSITRIARSTSLASGATLSLYRLAVEYGESKEVIISPADRRGFIRAIAARAPNVVIEDLDEYR